MENHTGELERSNVAFKCNYCDGCAESGAVGFNGICSADVMRYNVEHRTWCSSVDCPCKQYLDGQISRTELYDKFSKDGLGCYESTMLRAWTAKAGIYQNGENKGKPMRLLKAKEGKLAVLSTRKPQDPESKRFIFAVFLIGEVFIGDDKTEGYVKVDSEWKIALNAQEAGKVQFWNYYTNINAPEAVFMGSGLHRYLSDEQAVQILRDIAKAKTEQSEKEFAQNFLNHFCAVNGLVESAVSPAKGALVRTDG